MVGMMLPSAAPAVLIFARVARSGPAPERPGAARASVRGRVSARLGGVQRGRNACCSATLATRALVTPMMEAASPYFAAALLAVAGAYQWSAWKRACLVRCRTPAAYLSENWRPRRAGAPCSSAPSTASYCVGCCWALMLLLFAGGVMSLVWIAGLSLFVLFEKLGPRAEWADRVAGGGARAGGCRARASDVRSRLTRRAGDWDRSSRIEVSIALVRALAGPAARDPALLVDEVDARASSDSRTPSRWRTRCLPRSGSGCRSAATASAIASGFGLFRSLGRVHADHDHEPAVAVASRPTLRRAARSRCSFRTPASRSRAAPLCRAATASVSGSRVQPARDARELGRRRSAAGRAVRGDSRPELRPAERRPAEIAVHDEAVARRRATGCSGRSATASRS